MMASATLHPRVHIEDVLDPAVVRLHFDDGAYAAAGAFDVRRGRSPLARACGMVMGLPDAGRRVPVRLSIKRNGTTERWQRTFGSRSLNATFKRTSADSVTECFGPMEFLYSMEADRRTLILHLDAMFVRLGPIVVRVPRRLSPRVKARASGLGSPGNVRACIVVLAPWREVLLAYRGEVTEVAP